MHAHLALAIGFIALLAVPAIAQDTGDIVVTASASLPGLALAPDRLAAASETLDAAALRRGGTTNLLRALDTLAAGVTLDDAQDNPWQPNLLYRGYEASPLGGNAQGLAVYVDGARFNQPFGDTMNWDLLPDIAVSRVALEGSNPVFGLNALGGAISVDLKTGRDFQGARGEAALGRFGRRELAGEAGLRDGSLSAYIAGSFQHDAGWRDHSPSTVRLAYAQLGEEGDWGKADLRVMAADTSLTGNGTSPVELLAARRSAVFTYPDHTANRYGRALLSADIALSDHLRLKPGGYFQHLRQRTANGDLSDAEPCAGDATILCLEGEDDAVVTDVAGTPFAAFAGDANYAQLNTTRTDTTGYGASLQLDSDAPMGAMANRLSVGVTFDGSRSHFSADSDLGALSDDRGFADDHGIIDMADGPIRPVEVVTHRDDTGVFAADMLSPAASVDVTVAARFNHSRVRLDDRLGTSLNGSHGFSRLNPAIGAVWRAGGGVALYGGYAEANRAPTPAELSCANPDAPCSLSAFFVDDPSLHQVVARTFEAGVRGHRDIAGGKLTWRVGGWRSNTAHDIIFAASDTRGRAFFRNVGTTRRQGIESEARLEARNWSATLSYVLTDATFRTGFTANSPDNPAADEDGLIEVVPGDHIPSIARNRFKASVTRRFGASAWVTLDGQYSSGRWLLGDEANLTRPTRGYWLANLAAGFRPLAQLELFGELHNVFDRRYATFGGFSETDEVDFAEAPGISDPRSLSPGQPRTWLAGARVKF